MEIRNNRAKPPFEPSAAYTAETGGLLLVNKPSGYTSFDVIARLRRASGIRRIGHTGTLDPMATGVLPVLFGRCAKFADLLPDTDKRYTAGVRLGITTDTLDITGTVLSERPVRISREALTRAMEQFKGKISQLPPMYSAVKVQGVRLYEMARKGQTVEREPRQVLIRELNLLSYDEEQGTLALDVLCSKGTYIRSLCADLGEALGCGAVLTELCRTKACGFPLSRCHELEEVLGGDVKDFLLPPDEALLPYGPVVLDAEQGQHFQNGAKLPLHQVSLPEKPTRYLRVYREDGAFLGLGEPDFTQRVLRVKVLYLCP